MATSAPRYSLFDKDGYWITDLRTMGRCSWTLPARGAVGELDFNLSRYEPKNRRWIIEFGCYILRRQKNMPDWLGVIYTPRNWPVNQTSFKAYHVNKIFAWRKTPTNLLLNAAAGANFSEILSITNATMFNEKPIFPNDISYGGRSVSEKLGNDALSHLTKIAQNSGQDFEVAYKFDDNGRIILLGNWYQAAGIDTQRWLREGNNIELSNEILQETGDLWNSITGVNNASTPSARLTSQQWNETAISKYGLYETTQVFSGVASQTALDSNVMSKLRQSINPMRALDLTALDVYDTYQFLAPGNLWSVDINFSGYGLNATVKILGMEIDDAMIEKTRLITEVQ